MNNDDPMDAFMEAAERTRKELRDLRLQNIRLEVERDDANDRLNLARKSLSLLRTEHNKLIGERSRLAEQLTTERANHQNTLNNLLQVRGERGELRAELRRRDTVATTAESEPTTTEMIVRGSMEEIALRAIAVSAKEVADTLPADQDGPWYRFADELFARAGDK